MQEHDIAPPLSADVSQAHHHHLALLAGVLASLMLSGCSEPTEEERQAAAMERLAAATLEGTADTGFYPRCSRSDEHQPGDCYNLRNFDPDDYTRQEHRIFSTDLEADGRRLTIMGLDDIYVFLNNITFTDSGALVAVGGPGLRIIKADSETDRAWEVQSFSGFADAFRDVVFRDANNGLATGNGSILYRTQDGGKHWHVYNETYNLVGNPSLSRQLNLPGEAYAIDYADASTAVAGGNIHMLRTTDDGQHWRPTGPDLGREAIQEIAFIDQGIGWAVGSAGKVFKTQDAGATWESIDIASDATYLMGLDFVGQHGCMAGSWQVWCTQDGGDSWHKAEIELPADARPNNGGYDITRLRLEDERNGWFITHYGWIYETHDGGASWQPWEKVPQAARSTLSGLEMWGMTVGAQRVWAVGQGSFSSPASQREDGTSVYNISSSAIILSWPRANPDSTP